MSVLQLVQCDGAARPPRADAFEKIALWDTDTTVTAENGPMERSNLEYYDTHLSSTCASGHSQLRQVVLGTYWTAAAAHSDRTCQPTLDLSDSEDLTSVTSLCCVFQDFVTIDISTISLSPLVIDIATIPLQTAKYAQTHSQLIAEFKHVTSG